MEKWIKDILNDKTALLTLLEEKSYFEYVERVGDVLSDALKNGNKIMLAGNGGSAADAQHFASEIVGRFIMERESLPAMSLCVDSSALTSIANDYGYEQVFARQVEGFGKAGDAFVAISTSGNSSNLVKAVKKAREKNIKTIGLLGKDGGLMKELCDYALIVPSDSTPRVQEIHAFTVHMLCELIERKLFTQTE